MQLDYEAFDERAINQFVLVDPKTYTIPSGHFAAGARDHPFLFEGLMLNAERLSDQSGAHARSQPLGRVISVCGSQATVGLSAVPRARK